MHALGAALGLVLAATLAATTIEGLACVAPPASAPVAWRGESWPEADRLFHSDPRWLGADAAFSIPLGGERVLWLFGDTYVATTDRGLRSESRMPRNTIAVQHGLDPSRATIEFHWGQGATSWMADEGERWFWPGHGVRLPGGPLVIFWSRVAATPGEGLGFRADGWKATLIENPDDAPAAWRARDLARPAFPAGILPAQGLVLEGEFVLGLAIREPGDHAGFALRIPAAELVRGELAGLELWDGAWTRASAASRPIPVLADAAPECSVHFDRAARRYVHVRSLGFGATTLAIATAERLTGPWSEPAVLFRPPECDRERPFVYAGKAHPELRGADLVATYATNSFDFAEAVRDTSLYYPRFVRLSRVP